jgi:hypothetical protein
MLLVYISSPQDTQLEMCTACWQAVEWGVFIVRGLSQLQGLAGRAHSKGLHAHPGIVTATVTHIVEAGAITGGTRCMKGRSGPSTKGRSGPSIKGRSGPSIIAAAVGVSHSDEGRSREGVCCCV